MSLETSTLTLAYINVNNNFAQLENNIRDISNNIEKTLTIIDNLYNKLKISNIDIDNLNIKLDNIENNM